MSLKLAVALVVVGTLPASADRTSGGKSSGGSGPLGQVSSGIATASGSASPTRPSGNASSENLSDDRMHRPYCVRTIEGRVVEGIVVDGRLDCPHGFIFITNERNPILGSTVAERSAPPSDIDFYLGAQKVQDSDGSLSIGLSVTDNRFRIAGTFSHYFENERDGGRVTMTLPTLTAGFRIDDYGATKVVLDGGVAYVRTKGDPMADSSITGAIVGVHVEHQMSNKLALVGSAEHMMFPDKIRAEQGLLGVRYKMIQASMRVLDFNVGPALYGPEVGVKF